MEIGLDHHLPTYAGGLGVLAGDTLKSCADLKVPILACTLLNREGYFHQNISEDGSQEEVPVEWNISDFLEKLDVKVKVEIEGRDVYITAWKKEIEGISGHKVPVLFLDTNLEENSDWDKKITEKLYGGDKWYRLCQEVVLGIGGVRIFRALGYNDQEKEIEKFHMNEGHSGFFDFGTTKRVARNIS